MGRVYLINFQKIHQGRQLQAKLLVNLTIEGDEVDTSTVDSGSSIVLISFVP